MARHRFASLLVILLPGIAAAADHDLVIVSATIKPTKANGKAWDAFKGLPDPFVQAGVAPGKGRMPTAWQKTAVAKDTLEPRWDEKLLFVALGDEVVLQVWDKDVSVHDAIGDYRFTVTRELVAAGKRTVQFGQVKELTFLVQPREVARKPVPPDPPARVKPKDPDGKTDVDLLPPDAIAFAALRVTDLWNSEAGKRLQFLMASEEKSFFTGIENWLGTPLTDVERVLVLFPGIEAAAVQLEEALASGGTKALPVKVLDSPPLQPILIVTTSTPYDPNKVRQALGTGSVEVEYRGRKIVTDGESGIQFVSRRLYVRGSATALKQFLELPPPGRTAGLARTALTQLGRQYQGVVFVNTGFHVGIMARLLAEKPERLAAFVEKYRDALSAVCGKETVEKILKDLAAGRSRNPEQAAAELVGLLVEQVSQRNPIPKSLQPFLTTRSATLGMDVNGVWRGSAQLTFLNASQAEAGTRVVRQGLEVTKEGWQQVSKRLRKILQDNPSREKLIEAVRKEAADDPLTQLVSSRSPDILSRAIKGIDALLAREITVKTDRQLVQVSFRTKTEHFVSVSGIVMGVLLEAVQKVRTSAARMVSQNNLKQIGLAIHNYASSNQDRLPGMITSKDGKPLFSWRVTLLPYLEQDTLYRQLKLDEPWNSEHNRKVLAKVKMPKVFELSSVKAPEGHTYFRMFTGPDTIAPAKKGDRLFGKPLFAIGNIPDGASNTIAVIVTAEPVHWAAPDELPLSPKVSPLKQFGQHYGKELMALLYDGSVKSISPQISEKTLRHAIMPADGNALGADW